MAISRDKKKEIVAKISDALDSSGSVVFVRFHGLSVSDTTAMRKALRDAGVSYTVAKKTLIRRALGDKDFSGDVPALEGEVAVASGADAVAPAREVYAFAKKHKGNVEILGGIFEKSYRGKEEMTEIASIPPTDTLRGMFANVINSPLQGLVIALSAIAEKKEAQ